MITGISHFKNWPRANSGAPLFTCSEDAIFFAQLIYKKPQEINIISLCRRSTLSALKLMRNSFDPDLDQMFVLAVKGQFYRECLEEVARIKKECKG